MVKDGQFLRARDVIEPETLADLWRLHSSRLLMIARSFGEPADDAVQEAFTSLATQPLLPDDPLAWLVRTARNWLISYQRKRRSQSVHFERSKSDDNWFASPTTQVDSILDGQQVTAWLQSLPDDERQVIVMHLWGGMTFRQIASAIQCSPATANRLYHGGLETLKIRANIINEVCHEPSSRPQ